MVVQGSSDVFDQVLAQGLCVDCGACVGMCPYFVSYRGKIARLFPCTLPQGRCYAHCPKTAVDLDDLSRIIPGLPYDGAALGHVRTILKSRAGDRLKNGGRFQNGGTVSALLMCAMDAGLIEAAALTRRKGMIPEAVLAGTTEDILSCAGSKYMAAPTLSTVNTYMRRGGRRLAVVGTPCQMTGLAGIRKNPLDRPDGYDPVSLSLGLFCTWALDTRRLIERLDDRLDTREVLAMDVPPPPSNAMVLTTRNGIVSVPLDEIRSAIPDGCRICPDMTAEFTDLSVGAHEGEPGWNTLIVRTQTGEELVSRAVHEGFLTCETMPEASCDQLRNAALAKKKRGLETARKTGRLNSETPALIVDDSLVEALIGQEAP
ncbi:Coenzyme F420 hydrogenase/dehydrogenase, beta subunit C-terminal domain [Desulfatiferula olefinivorans]